MEYSCHLAKELAGNNVDYELTGGGGRRWRSGTTKKATDDGCNCNVVDVWQRWQTTAAAYNGEGCRRPRQHLPSMVGEPVAPPLFFFWRESQKSKSEKREEKETDYGLMTSPFPSLSFSNASFRLPAFSTMAMSRHKISPILATS